MKTNLLLGTAAILLYAIVAARADIIAGPITNPSNGHDYYLLSPNTWELSEDEAEVLDGTLAIITNASEQDWVISTFSSRVNHNGLWIGLHRTKLGGPFVWVTGASTNYSDWGTGEPNNSGGIENCVQLQNEPSDTGKWNDMPNDALLNGIVELPDKAEAGLSRSERSLIGTWYVGGDKQRPCWITATEDALFIISDSKYAARAGLCADGSLFVPGWPAGYSEGFTPYFSSRFPGSHMVMRGEIIKDKILWSNGTWWSRKPSDFIGQASPDR
jgi:Lectin C-type domain